MKIPDLSNGSNLLEKYKYLSIKPDLSKDEADIIADILDKAQNDETLSRAIHEIDQHLYVTIGSYDNKVIDRLDEQNYQLIELIKKVEDIVDSDNFLVDELPYSMVSIDTARNYAWNSPFDDCSQSNPINFVFFDNNLLLSKKTNSEENNYDDQFRTSAFSFDCLVHFKEGRSIFLNKDYQKRNISDRTLCSELQTIHFIDQIIDTYSPQKGYSCLIREYYYLSLSQSLSNVQVKRLSEILELAQTDCIVSFFTSEIDRWILQKANSLSQENCDEYKDQEAIIKELIGSYNVDKNDEIKLQQRIAQYLSSWTEEIDQISVLLATSNRDDYSDFREQASASLLKSEDSTCQISHTCIPINKKFQLLNPVSQVAKKFGQHLKCIQLFKALSSMTIAEIASTVCTAILIGGLGNLAFSSFFSPKDVSSLHPEALPANITNQGNIPSATSRIYSSKQNKYPSAPVSKPSSTSSLSKSSVLSTNIKDKEKLGVASLITTLEQGQLVAQTKQQSLESSQQSAEAEQLAVELYQKFAESQQLLAEEKQIKAERQHQQEKAEQWSNEAKKWQKLSYELAKQAKLKNMQAQQYLLDSKQYLSLAQQYLAAIKPIHSYDDQALNSSITAIEASSLSKTPSLASVSSADLSINLENITRNVVATIFTIGLGISIGMRYKQNATR